VVLLIWGGSGSLAVDMGPAMPCHSCRHCRHNAGQHLQTHCLPLLFVCHVCLTVAPGIQKVMKRFQLVCCRGHLCVAGLTCHRLVNFELIFCIACCDFGSQCTLPVVLDLLQNEIEYEDAVKLVNKGVKIVLEGANMPSTNDAISHFHKCDVVLAAAKACNAGGVAVSGLEMAQNAGMTQWSCEEVDNRLKVS